MGISLRIASAVGLAVALAACASAAGPPVGPHHDPVNSPEPTTPCPSERAAAVTAREALLGGGAPDARAKAAGAVLVHARCEGKAFSARPVPRGGRDQVIADLRVARQQYATAINLFEEAAGYGVAEVAVAALVAEAGLGQDFAALLATMPLPSDVTEATPRAELRGEIAELVTTLAGEAVVAAARGLALVDDTLAANAEVARQVAAACAIIARLDAGALADEPRCAAR